MSDMKKQLADALLERHAAKWLQLFSESVSDDEWSTAMYGLHTGLAMATEDPERAREVTHMLESFIANQKGVAPEVVERSTRTLMREQREKREAAIRSLR